MSEPLLTIENVTKRYATKKNKETVALNNINLTIFKGETLGLVGESGSGKTTLGKLILGLEHVSSGQIIANESLKKQIIFQDPFSALNPKMSAVQLVEEALWEEPDKTIVRQKAIAILEKVGITGEAIHKKTKHFSGGQRQRIGIARAVVNQAQFIVCDEPTSALDVSIQAQIITVLTDLKKEYELAYLFISHDLGVVEHLSDRIAVMYRGHLVELATTRELFENPQHPYTKKLLRASLSMNPKIAKKQLHESASESQENLILSEQSDWVKLNDNHYVRREL